MDLVLVSINFSPEPTGIARYAREYADILHGDGRNVIVVAGVPHYPTWRRGTWDDAPLPYHIERCEHYVPARPNAVLRSAYELSFALSVRARLARMPRADVVVAIVPTLASALVAGRWAKARGSAFAVVVQDIVSAATLQTGALGSVAGAGARWIERGVLSSADRVGVIHPVMVPAVTRLGARDRTIEVVPNWPLGPPRDPPTRDAARQLLGIADDRFLCVYSGNIGAKQGLEVLVDAARVCARRGLPIRFVIVGEGNQRARLVADAAGAEGVEVWPLQSEDRYRALLGAADALVLTQRATVREMSFPGKLIEYARAARPIVAAVAPGSATGDTLRRAAFGVIVPSEDAESLVAAIDGLRRSQATREALVEHARRYLRDELDPTRLRAAFLAFVDHAAARA